MEKPQVMNFDDLPHNQHAHEFVGADHGDVPFSIILVHAAPGAGPRLHRHPYPELFVVESGAGQLPARRGHDGGPRRADRGRTSQRPHGFANIGTEPPHVTAIHGAAAFDTEWLTEPDPVWGSKQER
jgi:hypothetical protein